MTQEQIDLIAEKIYGWKLGYDDEIPVYLNEDNQPFLNRAHFRPDTSVVQAIEALKKFCKDHNINRWELEFFLDKFICRISSSTDIDEDMGVGQSKNEAEAISLALIEAIGGKG